jgi:hypothetical protein
MKLIRAWLLSLCFAAAAWAHVGSPNTVFEAKAGEFPVRIVIREPSVVPGLADISVRVLAGTPDRVTVRPVHGKSDLRGAPRADVATPTPGETNLYTAALWFMEHGAYGVQVNVEGKGGGSLIVPVNALALDLRPMSGFLSALLAALGVILLLGLTVIIAGASRESTLPENVVPGPRRTRISWIGALAGISIGGGLAHYGAAWWREVDGDHRVRGIFHPTEISMRVATRATGSTVSLEFSDPRPNRGPDTLSIDHGRLLHLFLVQESPPAGALPAFAHLHPIRSDKAFLSQIPPLPAGRYRTYLDLTRESGITETVTNTIELPPSAGAGLPDDHDDAWLGSQPAPTSVGRFALPDGGAVVLNPVNCVAGAPIDLVAKVTGGNGLPAVLEPYLGMLGHAVIERDDGAVFAHVHPSGTISLAAARQFAGRIGGTSAIDVAEIACGNLSAVPPQAAVKLLNGGEVSFPYVFDRPGSYRVWTQFKTGKAVATAVFPVNVEASTRR